MCDVLRTSSCCWYFRFKLKNATPESYCVLASIILSVLESSQLFLLAYLEVERSGHVQKTWRRRRLKKSYFWLLLPSARFSRAQKHHKKVWTSVFSTLSVRIWSCFSLKLLQVDTSKVVFGEGSLGRFWPGWKIRSSWTQWFCRCTSFVRSWNCAAAARSCRWNDVQ